MKKQIAFLLLSTLGLSLLGCSSEKNDSSSNDSKKSDNVSTASKTDDKQSDNDEMKDPSSESNDNDSSTDNLNIDPSTKEPTSNSPTDNPFGGPFNGGGNGNGEGAGISSSPVEVTTTDSYDFHAYKNLNALLSKYVSSSGKVNYAGIKSNKSSLDKIIKEFKDNYPGSGWSSNKKLSYWINAYNIFTIKLIVDNYPTSSITKITAKPWDKKFVKLGSHTYSLNHVENEIIRKKFNEPRVHFALNCASKSCPVLLNAAYTASNVQSKLTSQTKRFFKDTSKNKFDNKKKIYISKIFEWYKEDFTKNGSTVVKFINKYRTEQLASPKILYTDYSWDLNN